MAKKRQYASCVHCGHRTTGRCSGCGSPLHLLECSANYMECDECIERRVDAEDRESEETMCGKECRSNKIESLADSAIGG